MHFPSTVVGTSNSGLFRFHQRPVGSQGQKRRRRILGQRKNSRRSPAKGQRQIRFPQREDLVGARPGRVGYLVLLRLVSFRHFRLAGSVARVGSLLSRLEREDRLVVRSWKIVLSVALDLVHYLDSFSGLCVGFLIVIGWFAESRTY